MTEEELKKAEKEVCEERGKCALRTMLKEFYCDTPRSIVILGLFWSVVFIAGAVYTGIKFFEVEQVQQQIMYATGFICFIIGLGLMKVFSWEIIHRNHLERDIKHLELRIMELYGSNKK